MNRIGSKINEKIDSPGDIGVLISAGLRVIPVILY